MPIDSYPSSNASTAGAVLGYVQATAAQGSISSTEVDVAGLAVTFTVPAGRRVRVTAKVLATSTVAGDNIEIMLKEGAAYLGNAQLSCGSATNNEAIHGMAVVLPSAGTHTYRATVRRLVGTGTLSLYADANVPSYLLVEDISGGTGGPGPIHLASASGLALSGFQVDAEVPGSSVTINAPAGRVIKVSAQGRFGSNVTGGHIVGRIREGATELGRFNNTDVVAGATDQASNFVVLYPTPGIHTYRLTAEKFNGGNTADFGQGTILVEDITGSEAPTGAYYEAQWTNVTVFTNSWVNYGAPYSPAGYRKVNDLVYMRGLIKNGTLSTPAFNLPVGYRPVWDHHFAGLSNSLLAGVRVFQDGRVTPGDPGSNLWISLDGIVFGTT